MKTIVHTSLVLLLALSLASCVKEDMTDCREGTAVTLLAGIADQQAEITQAVIYAFGGDGRLLETRATVAGRREVFDHPHAGELTFVGWCNTAGVQVVPSALGEPADRGYLSLIASGPAGFYTPPSDLFFGQASAANSGGTEEGVIYAYRMDARMTVTVIGLKGYTGFGDDDYSVSVGTTPSRIDFDGNYSGGPASYAPPASFLPSGNFSAPQFNLFPSQGQALMVRLCHAGTEIFTASADSEGNPFTAVADQTLNVLIDLRTGVEVSLRYSVWTEVVDWEKIYR